MRGDERLIEVRPLETDKQFPEGVNNGVVATSSATLNYGHVTCELLMVKKILTFSTTSQIRDIAEIVSIQNVTK